jgi:hypothetical protein
MFGSRFRLFRIFEQETCSAIVKSLQENSGEIDFNFIFTNDLIFEGRNFDAAVNMTLYDSLHILVLNKVETLQEVEKIFEKIDDFLDFAVNVSKLTENFKIHGDWQVKNTVPPDDVFSNFIKSHAHFGDFDLSCNLECSKSMFTM